jgi:hypothetical protein
MPRYGLASRTSNVTIANACWELRSGANDRLHILELGIFLAAATASTFGFGRPAAIGVTPTSPVTVLPEDGNQPTAGASGSVALAWGTGPTVPANFLRRIGFPATIGAGVIWTFPYPGIVVPVSSSIVLWNITATGVADVYVSIEE